MIISDIERYLAERGRAPLIDMANRFDTDADALRGMLAVLERKGRVRKLAAGACSSGCGKCDPAALELYEAIER